MRKEEMTAEEQEAVEVMKAITNKKLRDDFLFYGRTLIKADQVKREQYGLTDPPPKGVARGGQVCQ
jgi:hypothetical protein